MKKITSVLTVFLLVSIFPSPLGFSAWVWSPEAGKFVNPDAAVQDTPQEQYDYAMDFYKQKDLKEAAEQLRRLLKRYPSSQIAPEGQYRLGAIYEEMGDYYKAFRAYRDLLQRYPQTERMSEVIEREFRIGNVFLSGKRAKLMGVGVLPALPRAVEIFKHLVDTAPYSEFGDRAQFHLGLAYKKSNHFEEAIQAFQTLIDQYPQSKLVPQARFQIADTSYLESIAATRDQRVIDRAAREIDQFLKRHPDANVSDKVAKLRQEIDEKNAEKNYHIGLFYEKENYLDSAFVYYRDVAARYGHTQWGTKAQERLQALEKPAEYLKSQEAAIQAKKQKLLDELQSLAAADGERKGELEWELERVEKEGKEIQKSKPATLKRRRAALRQKEKEVKEKWKVLAKKKKRFAKSTSEDLLAAFERWEVSLQKEEADLVREKLRIDEWENNLGVDTTPFYAHLMPFGKEVSPLEEVRQIEAKRFAELAREKVDLLQEKENLYREYEKLVTLEGAPFPAVGAATYSPPIPLPQKLESQLVDVTQLAKELEEKERLYEEHFGHSPWTAVWRVPTKAVTKSVGLLNPFEGDSQKDWESKSIKELKTLRSHWQEKVSSQKTLVETIAQAFDDELARAEEKRLLTNVQAEESDTNALRRAIKQLEREIRGRYNEIQDRNERKNELLEKLEETLREKDEEKDGLARAGSIVTAPLTGTYKFWRAFLFGLPQRDVELTQEAQRVSGDGASVSRAQDLKKEIELESLLIQARSEEIERLSRELEALRARASFSQAPAFRSLLIKFPYVFVREAILSASRLVPKESRQAKLVEQLNGETEELEQLKAELIQLDRLIRKKTGVAEEAPEPKLEEPKESPLSPVEPPQVPDQSALRTEIQSLQKQLEVLSKSYEEELVRFEEKRWAKLPETAEGGRSEKAKEIEEELVKLIEKEQKIHQEESALLVKKKERVEKFLTELPQDLFTEELNVEKQDIESRLNEIQKRRATLGEELRRFRPESLPPF